MNCGSALLFAASLYGVSWPGNLWRFVFLNVYYHYYALCAILLLATDAVLFGFSLASLTHERQCQEAGVSVVFKVCFTFLKRLKLKMY